MVFSDTETLKLMTIMRTIFSGVNDCSKLCHGLSISSPSSSQIAEFYPDKAGDTQWRISAFGLERLLMDTVLPSRSIINRFLSSVLEARMDIMGSQTAKEWDLCWDIFLPRNMQHGYWLPSTTYSSSLTVGTLESRLHYASSTPVLTPE